jgi:hypothetical protein
VSQLVSMQTCDMMEMDFPAAMDVEKFPPG